jgi:hypothetical protein
MSDDLRVEVDYSDLTRGLSQFTAGLESSIERVGRGSAESTARSLRGEIPVRSGRLAATVAPVAVEHGGGVTYGGLPYAHYIEGRTHAVAHAVDGAEVPYRERLEAAAETEARRV